MRPSTILAGVLIPAALAASLAAYRPGLLTALLLEGWSVQIRINQVELDLNEAARRGDRAEVERLRAEHRALNEGYNRLLDRYRP